MNRTIKRIYEKTGDASYVEKAVGKGWIKQEEANEILGIVTE